MSLASRNAIVTGSTSGIGLAIARALAKEGANILINGFNQKTFNRFIDSWFWSRPGNESLGGKYRFIIWLNTCPCPGNEAHDLVFKRP